MKRVFLLILSLVLSGCASSNDSVNEFSGEDLMFASMMVPHHEQAIVMSELALTNSQDPGVIEMATAIKTAQDPEIAEMKSWGNLVSHEGHLMDGMLSDDEIAELRKARGAKFDRLFLEGMIKHHEGAIEMAQMVVNSENKRAADLGKSIIDTQQAEIAKMQELLGK